MRPPPDLAAGSVQINGRPRNRSRSLVASRRPAGRAIAADAGPEHGAGPFCASGAHLGEWSLCWVVLRQRNASLALSSDSGGSYSIRLDAAVPCPRGHFSRVLPWLG